MCGPELLQDEGHYQASAVLCFSGFGKRPGRGPISSPGVSSHPTISSLAAGSQEGALSVFCRRLRRSFLVDSGADVSVFPASASQKKLPSSKLLQAANGSSIKTFGKKKISLSFPGLGVVHRFLLADVEKPILGSDFFRANDLLIDIAKCRLVKNSAGNVPTPAVVVKARPARFAGGLCGLRCGP